MLIQQQNSQLILIDIQQRLADVMQEQLKARAIHNSVILAQAAQKLATPTIITRQYPKGLGELVPEIQNAMPDDQTLIDKTSFSCCGVTPFTLALDKQRRQIIIAGMETHVCVLQTAHELAEQDYQVFVVEDAVCSRKELNHHNALQRLSQAGIIITNTESVLFEWLRDAQNEHFKAISQMIKS